MRQHLALGVDRHRRLAGEKVLQRGRAALVVHRREFHARGTREHHPCEMRRAARRGRRIGRLLRIRSGPLQELRHRRDARGQHRPGGERERAFGTDRHRRKVLQRVVVQLAVAVRKHRHPEIGREQHDAAVRIAALHQVHRDLPVGPWPVVHDHRRRVTAAQLLRHQPRDHVRASARGGTDDDSGGFGEGLGQGRKRNARYGSSASPKKKTAAGCHGRVSSKSACTGALCHPLWDDTRHAVNATNEAAYSLPRQSVTDSVFRKSTPGGTRGMQDRVPPTFQKKISSSRRTE